MAGEKAEHLGNIHRTFEDGERLVTTPPYTAYLKIAEGCAQRPRAFCIIPKPGVYRACSTRPQGPRPGSWRIAA